MEQKPNYYSTFKFYDERGRRLSIFAQPEKRGSSQGSKDILVIYVFTCSKQDVFSKKRGQEIFKDYLTGIQFGGRFKYEMKPFKHILHIDTNPKKTFIDWCRCHYKSEKDMVAFIYGGARILSIKTGKHGEDRTLRIKYLV